MTSGCVGCVGEKTTSDLQGADPSGSANACPSDSINGVGPEGSINGATPKGSANGTGPEGSVNGAGPEGSIRGTGPLFLLLPQ